MYREVNKGSFCMRKRLINNNKKQKKKSYTSNKRNSIFLNDSIETCSWPHWWYEERQYRVSSALLCARARARTLTYGPHAREQTNEHQHMYILGGKRAEGGECLLAKGREWVHVERTLARACVSSLFYLQYKIFTLPSSACATSHHISTYSHYNLDCQTMSFSCHWIPIKRHGLVNCAQLPFLSQPANLFIDGFTFTDARSVHSRSKQIRK